MLQKVNSTSGFILNGFPRTNRQANLFVKEIGDVDVIVYLYSETHVLVTRTQQKHGPRGDPETIKAKISSYCKDVKEGLSGFGAKVEKVKKVRENLIRG